MRHKLSSLLLGITLCFLGIFVTACQEVVQPIRARDYPPILETHPVLETSAPTLTLSPAKTPRTTNTALPVTKIAPPPTVASQEPITAANFRYLQKLFQTRIDYDLDWFNVIDPGSVQLIYQPGQVFIAQADTKEIQIIDIHQNQVVRRLTSSDKDWTYVPVLAVSGNGKYLAAISGSTDEAAIWDIWQEKIIKVFPNILPDHISFNVALSEDGQYLALAGCFQRPNDDCYKSTVLVFDTLTGKKVVEISGIQKAQSELQFSPDNERLFISGIRLKDTDPDLLVWNIQKNALEFERSLSDCKCEDHFFTVELDETKDRLVAVSHYGRIYTWDMRTWQEFQVPEALPSNNCFTLVSGDLILFCDLTDPGEAIFMRNMGQKTEMIRPGNGRVGRVFVSPDKRFLYILDEFGNFEEWGAVR